MAYCPECDELMMHGDGEGAVALANAPAHPLLQLSAAIACGDLADARHWLEQVGAILGEPAQTEIDTGRLTPNLARGPGTTR